MQAVLKQVLACIGAPSADALAQDPDSDLEALLEPTPPKARRPWVFPAGVLARIRTRAAGAPSERACDDVC